MGIFNKKQKEEPSPVKSIEDVSPKQDDNNDKKLIIQTLMEDPEVKAYLAVMRGGEKFRIAVELEKEN